MKVLVASERAETREQWTQLMESFGHPCVAVGDGVSAARAVQFEAPPRILLLEWLLPELDGPKVCERIRSFGDHGYTYCILVGPMSSQDARTALLCGADDYIALLPGGRIDAGELAARLRAAKRIIELQEQLKAAREALRFESTHDSVSGVLNRSGLREHLQREFERARRFGTSLGAVFVDLDHFRLINESFGYQAGDAALRETAYRIRNTVRAYDVVGRYGADEFLILSPEVSAQALMAQSERILHALAASPFRFDDQEIMLTASIGVASNDDRNSNEMVQAAEAATKAAKNTGGNSVEFARNFSIEEGMRLDGFMASMRPN
jgi:two-component system cell cycle response regulator